MAALTVVASLAVAIVALLAARVTIAVEVTRAEKLRARARLIALYGLVDTEVSTKPRAHGQDAREPVHRMSTKKAAGKNKKRTARSPGTSFRRAWAALSSEGVAAAFSRYVSRLWHSFDCSELSASLRVGLADPADTGLLWGVVGPFAITLSNRHPDFSATPVFDTECLDIQAKGRLSVVPLMVIAATLTFVLTPAVWRAAHSAWRAR